MLVVNGLTEEQWAFARAVAGLVESGNREARRYREALERIANYDDDKYECYASTLARIAREALEG